MSFSLDDLKFNKWIQEEVSRVIHEDFRKLRPGDRIPKGAKVAGVMPDPLKALMYVIERLDVVCSAEFDELFPDCNGSVPTQKQLAKRVARMNPVESARWKAHANLGRRINVLYEIFWENLRTEFPELDQYDRVDYGPEYQVFGVNFDGVALATNAQSVLH